MQNAEQRKLMIMRVICFALIIDFIILDQLSKWFILENIFRPELGQKPLGLIEWFSSTERLPFISLEAIPYLNLTMVWNEGISFGFFQNGNPWPLIVLALIISTVFGVWLTRSQSWFEGICLSMIIGGALGNVLDRLHFGAVADFIDFYIGAWHYPAFNLADSFITVGIVMLVINSLFFQPNKEND